MKTDKNKTGKVENVEIVAYEPKHRVAFKTLNEEWIDTYFKLEDEDRKLLDDPQKNILDKGGAIIIALLENEVIGTCALIPMENPRYEFEIGKMAVSPKARGRGVGELLGRAIIQKAKDLGAQCIYLESNTVLQPAIQLYRKLGFREVIGHPSPYSRCNIQMELDLS